MTSSKKEQGFTLVEVLIAMFVFSLISVGTMTALTTSLQGQEQMSQRLDDISEIELSRALMKSDFSNIIMRPVRDNLGSPEPYVLSGGMDSLLTFSRGGRVNPAGLEARSEFQRISYVFENGALIRRSLEHVNPAPQTSTMDRVILQNLTDVSVQFRVIVGQDANNIIQQQVPVEQVLIAPGQTQDLPKIMTIEAEFLNGDRLIQHFELSL